MTASTGIVWAIAMEEARQTTAVRESAGRRLVAEDEPVTEAQRRGAEVRR